jgi:hypothetical protein
LFVKHQPKVEKLGSLCHQSPSALSGYMTQIHAKIRIKNQIKSTNQPKRSMKIGLNSIDQSTKEIDEMTVPRYAMQHPSTDIFLIIIRAAQ